MSKKTRVDYVTKIAALGWPQLVALWSKIEASRGSTMNGWPKGKAFEHLILRAFELEGAEVIWPYTVQLNGDVVEQIDGMVIFDGISCIIEAKDKNSNLNIEPMAKLRNQLLRRPAGILGSIFASGGFTEPAVTLAHFMAPQAILLWQGPEIGPLIANQKFREALIWKYRVLIQHGKPDYDSRAGTPT